MRKEKSIMCMKLKSYPIRIFKTAVVLLLLMFFCFSTLIAQEVIPATGGTFSDSGGTVSYSVGQIVFNIKEGAAVSFAEGVQQPYEISVITGIDKADINLLSVSAYPNPTKDYLSLTMNNYEFSSVAYRLYNISGALIDQQPIKSTNTRISMLHLTTGIYFIKVLQADQQVKTFKIVKN